MALLDDVKQYIDELSSDELIDKKVKQIIARAKSYLRRFDPMLDDNDFEEKTSFVHSLLLDYCRYDFCNASEDFKANYKDELIDLRNHYKVKMYEFEEAEN